MEDRLKELLQTLRDAILEAERIRSYAEVQKIFWMVEDANMTLENLKGLKCKVEQGQAKFGYGYGFTRGVDEWGGGHANCDRLCRLAARIDELCRKLG